MVGNWLSMANHLIQDQMGRIWRKGNELPIIKQRSGLTLGPNFMAFSACFANPREA